MKRLTFLSLLILFFGLTAWLGCNTSSTSMQVLVPAQIYIPQHIQKVGVTNRSLPEKKEQVMNFLEGLITGESIFADREGSWQCVHGLVQQLNNSPRFQAISLDALDLRGTGTREFPVPLDWNRVEQICKQYGVDALICLETFDSNIGLRQGSEQKKKTVDKKEVTYTEFFADLIINVGSGWRIYDPKNRRIIDQNIYADEKRWSARGESANQALSRLPSKRNAINEAGFFSGTRYGIRISPAWMNVNRSYYSKGHDYFKLAKKEVRYENWQKAEDFWKTLADNPDPKIAGRAHYNLALAYEMKGDLQQALKYATIASQKYHNSLARSYIYTLNQRILDQEKLKKQMEGE